ncbi:MAG: non-ribosomal peptide synthetase, partial [bacterium]|nr:non-ribosomal peptide synthetase [bacterium]
KLQYKDYSYWQNSEQNRENRQKQEEYWLKQFEEDNPTLNLPTDYPRPARRSLKGSTYSFIVEEREAKALKELALSKKVSLYIMLLSIYNVYLAKISDRTDIVVGTVTAGRRHADLENIIGMFVNTLAMRNYPNGEKVFTDFLDEVKESTLQAYDNQDYQYETLVDKLAQTGQNRNRLFDVTFILQNVEKPEVQLPGLTLTPLQYQPGIAKFDMTLTAVETGKNLVFTIEYNTDIFKEETIKRQAGYIKEIVTAVITDENTTLKEIKISHDLAVLKPRKKKAQFDF